MDSSSQIAYQNQNASTTPISLLKEIVTCGPASPAKAIWTIPTLSTLNARPVQSTTATTADGTSSKTSTNALNVLKEPYMTLSFLTATAHVEPSFLILFLYLLETITLSLQPVSYVVHLNLKQTLTKNANSAILRTVSLVDSTLSLRTQNAQNANLDISLLINMNARISAMKGLEEI